MRVEITKAAAAAIILGKLNEGVVQGGAYVRSIGNRWAVGQPVRCAIGWLFTEKDAKALEARAGQGNYALARQLCEEEVLVTDDDDWFIRAQKITDDAYNLPNLNLRLGNHCRAALPPLGYDIGNRRSDPGYAKTAGHHNI